MTTAYSSDICIVGGAGRDGPAPGVDYSRVLEGMKKDYPRARDIPFAGFAAGPGTAAQPEEP